ncbi:MAG: LD-carboxypeptidase, partial [Ferruginibacter sp.]
MMNRKKFISALVPLGASLAATANVKKFEDPDSRIKIPEYLNPGDIIGITSPAGYITDEDIRPSILKLQEWGYNIKTGNTIGKRDFTYGGTDAERLTDFQQMLDDKNVKAVMCARGGYGALRIIDKIDFTNFVAHPKWIIGFSDITVMH